jgi:hypothetical protein
MKEEFEKLTNRSMHFGSSSLIPRSSKASITPSVVAIVRIILKKIY